MNSPNTKGTDLQTYEVTVHYTDDNGVECEALHLTQAYDEARAQHLTLDWAEWEGIAPATIADIHPMDPR